MPTCRPSLAQNRACASSFQLWNTAKKGKRASYRICMIQMCRETFDLAASGVRWWIAMMSCCLVFNRKFRGCKHADNLRI